MLSNVARVRIADHAGPPAITGDPSIGPKHFEL